MHVKKINCLIVFLLLSTLIFSQNLNQSFIYPLGETSVITGNYGELRHNHFHAGLDFRTDPTLNLPIKSIDDGYVSRIKISSGGYGKVIYITHLNGFVSVYAHQKKYSKKINDYVEKKQIDQQKNEIEIFLTSKELEVKKGEVIGYTGNSGSSTGPHLHFEIREEKSEIPINPLLIYNVTDNVKPILTHIAIYNHNTIQKTIPIRNTNNKLSISNQSITVNENVFSLAYAGYDEESGSTNKNNIYEAKLTVDDSLIYHHQLDLISFDNARYINVFSETKNGVKYQKCFVPSCYNIKIYKKIKHNGNIVLNDTIFHKINLEVKDEKGNKNTIHFFVKTKQIIKKESFQKEANAYCNTEFNLTESNCKLKIKSGSLPEKSKVFIQSEKNNSEHQFKIKSSSDFLLTSMEVSIKPLMLRKNLENKLVMLCNNNCIGGKIEKDWITAESKTFGNFKCQYDTVLPTITVLNSNKNKSILKIKNSISFKISDNLSGIKDYNLYINDIWHIAEYDAKTATLTCFFNEKTPTGKLNIYLEVKDKVDNRNTFKLSAER